MSNPIPNTYRTVYDRTPGAPQPSTFSVEQNKINNQYYVNDTCSNLNSGHYQPQQQPRLGQQAMPLTPLYGNPENLKEVPLFGGNWSRLKYDRGSLEVDTRQATAPLEYTLDPNYAERCNQCRPEGPGWLGKQGVSYDTNVPIVDTESELFNLNRVLTRDPNYQYLPNCPKCGNCDDGLVCGGGVVAGCDMCQPKLYNFPSCNLQYEYTRTSNPICTLKETGFNRFQPICLNPQDETRWLAQNEVGINYRLVAKDNHVPCLPFPIDQSTSEPLGGDIPCSLVTPTCSAYTAPMHNYYNFTTQ